MKKLFIFTVFFSVAAKNLLGQKVFEKCDNYDAINKCLSEVGQGLFLCHQTPLSDAQKTTYHNCMGSPAVKIIEGEKEKLIKSISGMFDRCGLSEDIFQYPVNPDEKRSAESGKEKIEASKFLACLDKLGIPHKEDKGVLTPSQQEKLEACTQNRMYFYNSYNPSYSAESEKEKIKIEANKFLACLDKLGIPHKENKGELSPSQWEKVEACTQNRMYFYNSYNPSYSTDSEKEKLDGKKFLGCLDKLGIPHPGNKGKLALSQKEKVEACMQNRMYYEYYNSDYPSYHHNNIAGGLSKLLSCYNKQRKAARRCADLTMGCGIITQCKLKYDIKRLDRQISQFDKKLVKEVKRCSKL